MLKKDVRSLLKEYFENYTNIPTYSAKLVPLLIIESIATGIFFFISIYFSKVLSLDSLDIGELISVFAVGGFIGNFISSYLTNRVKPENVSALFLFLYGFSTILLVLFTSKSLLIVVMGVAGCFASGLSVSNMASLLRGHSENRETMLRIINLESVIFNVCIGGGALILNEFSRYSLPIFLFTMGCCLILFSIYAYVVGNSRAANRIGKITQEDNKSKNKRGNKKPLNNSILWMLSTVFAVGMIFSLVKVFFPATVNSRFGDSFLSAFVLSINPLVVIFLQPFLVNRLAKYNNLIVIGLGGLLLGLGFCFFGVQQSIILSVIFVFIATVGEVMFSAFSKDAVVYLLGEGKEGVGIGVWKIIYTSSTVIGATFTGYLGTHYGDGGAWSFSAVLGFYCLFITLLLYKNKSKRDEKLTGSGAPFLNG